VIEILYQIWFINARSHYPPKTALPYLMLATKHN